VTEDNEWRVDDEDYEVDIDGALEDLRSAVVLVLARFGVPAQGDCARPVDGIPGGQHCPQPARLRL
jgi:hypothetical protein